MIPSWTSWSIDLLASLGIKSPLCLKLSMSAFTLLDGSPWTSRITFNPRSRAIPHMIHMFLHLRKITKPIQILEIQIHIPSFTSSPFFSQNSHFEVASLHQPVKRPPNSPAIRASLKRHDWMPMQRWQKETCLKDSQLRVFSREVPKYLSGICSV